MRPQPACIAVLLLLVAPYTHGDTPLPAESGAVQQAAAKYRLSMNMLLFPDYFMSEEQFQAFAAAAFKDTNLKEVVEGLNAYGVRAVMPRSAAEYRLKTYPAMLDLLRRAGYAAIEVPINQGKLELCPQLRADLEKRGFAITAVGMAGEDLEASLKPKIDVAHALGATVIAGPIVLPFKQYPKEAGDNRVTWVQKKLASLEEPMRRLAEYAQSKDIRLAVEPLNRFELPGLNRLADAIAFVKAVDHPNFGVMIDTCHEMSDGDGGAEFARQVQTLMRMNRLFDCHISAIHRGRVDRAWIDWQHFFGPLLASDYRGNMSMEIFDAVPPFSEVVHVNRRRFDNPMEVAVAALVFSAEQLERVKR